jgi:hypothetical protein
MCLPLGRHRLQFAPKAASNRFQYLLPVVPCSGVVDCGVLIKDPNMRTGLISVGTTVALASSCCMYSAVAQVGSDDPRSAALQERVENLEAYIKILRMFTPMTFYYTIAPGTRADPRSFCHAHGYDASTNVRPINGNALFITCLNPTPHDLSLPCEPAPPGAPCQRLSVGQPAAPAIGAPPPAPAGETIRWINNDTMDHSATVSGAWDVLVHAHASATLKMDRAGTFHFFCRFHPNMTGQVTVAP